PHLLLRYPGHRLTKDRQGREDANRWRTQHPLVGVAPDIAGLAISPAPRIITRRLAGLLFERLTRNS
ncbi:MAG: hypothetical protein K9K36_15095, partial [Desulfarculaceae bacterium]|nr:hypothetical protein [Desulfarculaceae bacterium]